MANPKLGNNWRQRGKEGSGRSRWSRWNPPPYKLSADDQWCSDTRKRAALKLGDWLIASAITHRSIVSLQIWELEALAQSAIDEYVLACSERYAAAENQSPDDSYLDSLLSG